MSRARANDDDFDEKKKDKIPSTAPVFTKWAYNIEF